MLHLGIESAQGVGGSNPLSPTILFNHLQTSDPDPLGLAQVP